MTVNNDNRKLSKQARSLRALEDANYWLEGDVPETNVSEWLARGDALLQELMALGHSDTATLMLDRLMNARASLPPDVPPQPSRD
jgi:hypothetical protein